MYLLALGLIAGGVIIRYLLREHGTVDTARYLIPWYTHARDFGAAALGHQFTNYTPFYTYLLLGATIFDGSAEPLALIKGMSALFEAGCAAAVAALVHSSTKDLRRSTLAFGVAWASPMVLFNGAAWGQADSMWAFFSLSSIWLFMNGRNGTLPFAVSFAVKAQGVFLGPFVLGNLIRVRAGPAWLISLPAVYSALALPVLLAGLPLSAVLAVYTDQAQFFQSLSMNAGNIWALFPVFSYRPGVLLGLLFATASGVLLTRVIARRKHDDPEIILLGACASLLLMPYLLPKMHERYFYAFELAILSLSFVNRRYILFAVLSQLNGFITYLPFELRLHGSTLPAVAAAINGFMAVFLCWNLEHGSRRVAPRPRDVGEPREFTN